MQNIYCFLDRFMPFEWLEYDFMKNAFLATVLIGLLFGFLGSMVVNNKLAFFSEALGHSALTGIGIGVILGVSDTLYSMIFFAMIMAVSIWLIEKRKTISTDTVIGVFSSTAVALGLVLLSKGGNFNKYSNYLIGDILSITQNEIILLAITFVVTLIVWSILFNKLVLSGVNASIAKSRRVNADILKLIFILILAIVVMISIKWVGILIINSLLILPAATARNISRNIRQYTVLSVIFSLASCLIGLIGAYYMETAAGASIVMVSAAFFAISLFASKFVD